VPGPGCPAVRSHGSGRVSAVTVRCQNGGRSWFP
jgi:hypothetical protein